MSKRTALFPGSFDPFTVGHEVIVEEGLKMFDHIIIGIGGNNDKRGLMSVESRKRLIDDIYSENSRVSVEIYDQLTGSFCREKGVEFMLRGMRNTVDYEYERNMMLINKKMFPEITTVLLFTPPDFVAISSSMIREVLKFGGDVNGLMPKGIDLKKYL